MGKKEPTCVTRPFTSGHGCDTRSHLLGIKDSWQDGRGHPHGSYMGLPLTEPP